MKKLFTTLMLTICLSAVGQQHDGPKVFFGAGIHEQSEQMMGSRMSAYAGLSQDVFNGYGLKAAYVRAIDLPSGNYETLNLYAYKRLFERDEVFNVLTGVGTAYEISNGDISPSITVNAIVRMFPGVYASFDWHPVANGDFRGPKGWANNVTPGIIINLN